MGMRYQAVAIEPTVAARLEVDADEDELFDLLDAGIDLDKMWHAAQILIGGSLESAEPLMTGHEVGDDVGYGPAHLASPDDVARVAAAVADLTEAGLIAGFDAETMAAQNAYPMIWDEPADELAKEAGGAAWQLVELYRSAAANGQAILAAVT